MGEDSTWTGRRVSGRATLVRGAAACSGAAVGWGSLWAVARTQAREREKRSARWGPEPVHDGWAHRTDPDTKVTAHQEQMSSLGCDMAGGLRVGWGWLRFHEDQGELPCDPAHPPPGYTPAEDKPRRGLRVRTPPWTQQHYLP